MLMCQDRIGILLSEVAAKNDERLGKIYGGSAWLCIHPPQIFRMLCYPSFCWSGFFFFFLLNYWIKLLFSGLGGTMGSLIEPQHPFGAGKCTGET